MKILTILEMGSVLKLCSIYALNGSSLCSLCYLGDYFFQAGAGGYFKRSGSSQTCIFHVNFATFWKGKSISFVKIVIKIEADVLLRCQSSFARCCLQAHNCSQQSVNFTAHDNVKAVSISTEVFQSCSCSIRTNIKSSLEVQILNKLLVANRNKQVNGKTKLCIF